MSGESNKPKREDFEDFLAIRRHIKRLQTGTPLLVRCEKSGTESLQICTVWISKELSHLCWLEHEGNATQHEALISDIVRIEEEELVDADGEHDEDEHFGVALHFRNDSVSLGLICASPEDLQSWRDGLRFLVATVTQTSPAATSESKESKSPQAAAKTTGMPVTAGATSASEAGGRRAEETVLHQRLRQQEELIAKLKHENDLLNEIVKRKDATIAELMREAKNRFVVERCNKTKSTSRESDDHLKDREITVLRRKNKRLQKELRAKQQTVKDLLQTVGRLNTAYESSAIEDNDMDLDVGGSDADVAAPVPAQTQAETASATPTRQHVGSQNAAAAAVGGRVSASPASKTTGSSAVLAGILSDTGGAVEDKTSKGAPMYEASDDENDIEDDEEMQALAAKLQILENAVAGLGGLAEAQSGGGIAASAVAIAAHGAAGASRSGGGPFAPSSRLVPKPPASEGNVGTASAPNARAAGAIQAARGMMGGGGITGLLHTPGLGANSVAALQNLIREMELLDEKKRVVESLAKNLEPPSDNEEDDGFPLR